MNKTSEKKDTTDLNSLIARYNAELMDYYRRSTPRVQAADDAPRTISEAEQPVEEMSAIRGPEDNDAGNEPEVIVAYPTRRIEDSPAAEPESPSYAEQPLDSAEDGNRMQLLEEAEEQTAEQYPEPQYALPEDEQVGDIGYLQIAASAGRTAQPVMNAYVTVSRPEPDGSVRLYWLALTDRDGNTQPLPLPTISRSESMKPGMPEPYLSYNVQVDATGYYTVRNLNIPIYGGIHATQPVEMIPLPEQTPNGTLTFPEMGPQDLD